MSAPSDDRLSENAEDASRRNFAFELLTLLISAVVGLVPAGIGLFAFLDPLRKHPPPRAYRSRRGAREGYLRVAALSALRVGDPPRRFPVISNKRDAWNFLPNQPIGAVYVQRIDTQQVRVFNVTCPHAGCSVSADGETFRCPCHNSAFNLDGSKLTSETGRENPSPRPLDQLTVDEELLAQGEIWVEFKNFYTGIEKKIPKA